jgi:ABC-2 type transport system ATP-binding protein
MLVEIENVTKHYGVRGISFAVQPGECVAIVGINGAGKSTLLQCVAGILAPLRGCVRLGGERLERHRIDLRKQVFFLPDVPVTRTNQSTLSYLEEVLSAYGKWDESIKKELLGFLRLFQLSRYLYHPMGLLSRGQAYKVALTTGFLIEPRLWLLDEPFASGMDAMGMDVLRNHLRQVRERNATVLFTTQILEIAESVATKVAILNDGQLVGYGSIDELRGAANCSGSLLDILRKLSAA